MILPVLRKLALSVCLLPGVVSVCIGQVTPKRLLIYYGYPSSFNYNSNSYDLNKVAQDFANYQYVVLGDGLEKSVHPDHVNTKAILQSPLTQAVKFFGYIDASTTIQNLSLTEIQTRVAEWKNMGIDGIFYDDFEYDYGVSRSRQNTVIGYARAQGLPVIVNGFKPDEIFGNQVDATHNPTGANTILNAGDFYLSESNLITEGTYQNAADWRAKADKLLAYQQVLGFRILSVTTNDATNGYSEAKFHYSWYGALLYGHEATGWGEYWFAASTALAPLRAVPSLNPGNNFANLPQSEGSRVVRYTATGQVWIDPVAHNYGFVACGSCQSVSSGSWHSAGTWSCGRVPLACDLVTIETPHVVTVSTADARCSILVQKGTLHMTAQYKVLLYKVLLSPR